MNEHLTEDQLVLVHYGEMPEGRAHLENCEECREQLASLVRTLELVEFEEIPGRGDDYGRWVWWRIRPSLSASRGRTIARWAAVAAAVVIIMAGAFYAGRMTASQSQEAMRAANRRRSDHVLKVALNEHFERSGLVLVEMANQQVDGPIDVSAEQERAEVLLTSNRLYRQAANGSGQRQTAEVLEDLERILMEISHSPSKLEPEEYEEIRQRINEAGILFKVKFAEQQTRQETLVQ